MKKILFLLLLAVCSMSLSAQAPSKKCPVCGLSIPKCQYKGKHPDTTKHISTPQNEKNKPTKGTENGREWVDLGLSVKWATCNIGASSESDYGSYYAWGETKTKDSYDWNNCFDCLDDKGDSWRIYKEGGKRMITPSSGHDTARENWGGNWRMPTEAECVELLKKCKWKRTNKNGHGGYLVTGPNGNSIFLPAAGFRYQTSRSGEGSEGLYWSSMHNSSFPNIANGFGFDSSGCDMWISNRCYGESVRPVID